MSYKLERAIWSRDIGQRISCFGRCQLIITWMFNIYKEVQGKPRLHVSVNPLEYGRHLGRLRRRRRRRRAYAPTIPLAMITLRKSTHGFPFLPHMSIELRLVVL